MQKLLLACILACPFALAHAQTAPSSPAPQQHQGGDHKETELDDKMGAMNGAFRKLRKQIADPASNASSLELVAKLLKGAKESAALTPAHAADIPEADRAKFVEAYKEKMKTFVAEVEKLEAALKAGNNEEAGKILTKLGAMQREGHREFRAPKKE